MILILWRHLDFQFRLIMTAIQKFNWTYFFLCLGTAGSGVAVDNASLRGRPRGRLSVGAGLPVGVAPELLGGGEGPLSEGSRLFSSDDILREKLCTSNILENIYNCMLQCRLISKNATFPGKLSIQQVFPALQQLYAFKTQHSPTSEVLILILLNTGPWA